MRVHEDHQAFGLLSLSIICIMLWLIKLVTVLEEIAPESVQMHVSSVQHLSRSLPSL